MSLIYTIPQGHCCVIERFGKPVRVQKGGLHFKIPFLEKFKEVGDWTLDGMEYSFKRKDNAPILIELSEQILDTKKREYFTKDNVSLKVDCMIRWRIVDPMKALYEVDQLHRSLIELALNEMRSAVGSRDLNNVLSSRAQINEEIAAGVAETCKRWGITVTAVEIQEMKADDDTVAAMRIQMEAARKAEAMRLEAKAKSESIIMLAEADKTAMALRAEAESAYIEMLAKVIDKKDLAKLLLAQKTLVTYSEIAKEPANKVFMPPPSGASTMVEAVTLS